MKGSVHLGEVRLESGEALPVVVAYETYGNPDAAHVVLVCHALTGSAHVMAEGGDDLPGWWEVVSGPGRLLDPERSFIVAQNVLGGCYGTTGPASPGPDGAPWGQRFPSITVRDMVRVERLALLSLGVDHVDLVVGGSLGGMQALEWAFTYPESVGRAVAIGAPLASDSSVIAYNAVQQAAIALDPERGLEVARMVGMITYRSPGEFQARFGRRRKQDTYLVGDYLKRHGEGLRARFDPWSYVRLTEAMDSHDVFHGRLPPAIRPEIRMVGIDPDVLFPPRVIRRDATRLGRLGFPSRYGVLKTRVGHDAFLLDGPGLLTAIGPLETEVVSYTRH